MNEAEARAYLHLLERRGKAKSLPLEKLEKYQEVFDGINKDLVSGLWDFLLYEICDYIPKQQVTAAGGTIPDKSKPSKEALTALVLTAIQTGLALAIQQAFAQGDKDLMVRACQDMRKIWKQERV
mgnify:CR=1 FL=1